MKVITHRCNSLERIKESIAYGVDGIEIDIRRCAGTTKKKGDLFIVHDINDRRRISNMTYAQLRALELAVLPEVLELVDGRIMINVEVKTLPDDYPGIEEDLLAVLAQYRHKGKLAGGEPGILVSSFDHDVLTRLHALSPEIEFATLIRRYLSVSLRLKSMSLPSVGFTLPIPTGLICDSVSYSGQLGASAWHARVGEATLKTVLRAHAAGLKINVWTANHLADWHRLNGIGVDGVITDDPLGCIKALDR